MALPLLEYHDPIDQAFAEVGRLGLNPLGPFEKPVNPGRTARFAFDVANQAPHQQTVHLSVSGHNAAWARWMDGPTLRLAEGERAAVRLAVDIPLEAQPGERAELFAVAEDPEDPWVVAISRLRASVVTNQDIPDQATDEADLGRSTPGPAAATVLLALALNAWRRRG